ncbi:MAG: erythromycin esterase family protein [Candidatus Competibacteraceae bacterium]|nr:erythromycin esterase family protein [Candidatus Competibacteraceae bacterium]
MQTLRDQLYPLEGSAKNFDPLIQRASQARFVLLGEASHGSHEFYATRALITRRLIEEHGFDGVAVEADWPDAYRVNRFVRGRSEDADAQQALDGFQRFPLWMWRNREVLDFVQWLADHNRERPFAERVGFYGLDLYSLYRSIEAVIDYLQGMDPQLAAQARHHYACLDHTTREPQEYGLEVVRGRRPSCEQEVVAMLLQLHRSAAEHLAHDGLAMEEEQFQAQQNARLVRNAEAYYRSMFHWGSNTWNMRDTHMADTLQALDGHLSQGRGRPARLVVWAHNSHLGDARATEMGQRGELNLGQLTRQRYGAEQTLLTGFTTYEGSVSAACDWDCPVERKRVRPGLKDSYEALFHKVGVDDFLIFPGDDPLDRALAGPCLERAIGVIYLPASERVSHYFQARLPRQFDVLIHHDRTRALEPLDMTAGWQQGETPETWPFGV